MTIQEELIKNLLDRVDYLENKLKQEIEEGNLYTQKLINECNAALQKLNDYFIKGYLPKE
jgi:hypothetical protein